MNADDYICEAKRTDVTDYLLQKQRVSHCIEALHGAMGIMTEAGELMDVYKKFIMYGKPVDVPNVKEEIGDILWYIALICHFHGISLEDAMITNIAKLRARYPEKFTEDKALNRDLNIERKILEG